MLAQLKPANLTAYVGTEFNVLDDPAQACCLTLSSVVEHLKTERQEAFSLFFRGPLNPQLLQGIHKLKHAQLGELEIFLVPVAQDKDGFQYEAAFNHVISM
jgi:hypothetical protein